MAQYIIANLWRNIVFQFLAQYNIDNSWRNMMFTIYGEI